MRACLPLLCAVLLLCSQAWCQSPPVQWSRFYGNAAGAGAMKTIQTPDGGYLIAAQVFAGGGMVSNHHGGEDIWLVKVDAAGDIQWERCFGGSAADRLSQLGHGGDIMVTNDGGYMLVGHSRSTDGDVTAAIEGNHGGWDAWVVKLSAAGNIQWQRSMGGSNDDFDFSVKQLADDSYVLAGHTLSNDHNVSGNHGMADTWVVKLNSAGTVIQWQKCLGSSEYELNAKLDLTSDGGIVVMSSVEGNDGDVSGLHSAGLYDYWIVKMNAAGTVQWQKCYGGTWDDIATGIKATPDGGCIVVGYVHSDDGDVTSNRGASDYWVAKVDAAGAIQWQKNYGSWSWELPYSIMAARNGHFIITGRSETAGDDGDVVGTIGDADVWTICIDGSGNLVWTKILGGTEWDDGTWIAPTTDGGYILTGVANSEDVDAAANPFPFAAWMVKFGPDATTLPVDLVNFSGKHDAGVNILEWTTAFERNNAYFILERSTDGLSFQPIATITGKGESSVPVQYAYVDNKNISHHDKLFYRLKQVDIDGTATASRIITLQRPYVFTQINGWQHKPGSFTVEVKAEKALSLTINIRDATGRLLEQKRYDISAGRILLNVPLSRYAGGACFVEVINGNNRRIFKAVNQ